MRKLRNCHSSKKKTHLPTLIFLIYYYFLGMQICTQTINKSNISPHFDTQINTFLPSPLHPFPFASPSFSLVTPFFFSLISAEAAAKQRLSPPKNMSGIYTSHSFSPARALSPQIRSTSDIDSQYLTELLAEHQKLGPFMQVLPICSRLLNQEILRVSGMVSNQGFGEFDRHQYRSPSPMASGSHISNVNNSGLSGWNGLPHERPGIAHGMPMDWHGAPASPSSYIVKKILRLEIPVDNYPNFNFVGRLLGPRGNSLKRVEASTGCRVYIRGKGSIKDPEKEEKLRGRPGYEHLSDPLHILVEAELPVNIVDTRLRQAQEIIEELLKPVDESQDFYKRQQLRELAMLNSSFREDSPHPSGSVSPFSNNTMKRAKTGR